MVRNLIKVAAITLLLITTHSARAVVVPAGLNPGDSYHLAFVTQGSRDATPFTIDPYNTFVQDEAALNSSLTGTDQGVQWFVIGSTQSDDARVNALVGTNVPVYLVDGTTKVADGFADMWDETIDNPIDIDQFGSSIEGLVSIHTGSNLDGTAVSDRFLGSSSNVRTGRTNDTTQWIDDSGAGLWDTARQFYALSQQLSVPVPEPITGSLIASGLLALLWRRRRR